MKQLVLEPTSMAQWQSLVHEAQASCDRHLDEMLESYLVFLLMRFSDKPHCTSRIMAEEFLRTQACTGKQRLERLRDVGDHCLIFSGLFPQLAERRMVRVSYFVNLGQSSYRQAAELIDRGRSAVYGHLSEAFVVLMDILHAMRELGGQATLTSLQALDLWHDTGSRRCYQKVRVHTGAMPLPASGKTH